MPENVQAFCKEGHFHDIEVEDDVTAFFEWKNGATGTFITSTGDAPGVNRLELTFDEAMIVCEGGKLRIGSVEKAMGGKERDYRKTAADFFRHIEAEWTEEFFDKGKDSYITILQNFADEISGRGICVADGREGLKSLLLTNAMYLSSWKKRMIKIPAPGSEEELSFEKEFEEALSGKIKQ